MDTVSGQSIVLTGGGSGLGRAVVERLCAEGAHVVVLERSPEKCQDLQGIHDHLSVVEGDVRDAEANARAVARAVEETGKLDCFIGCAAILDFVPRLMDLDADQITAAFHEVMAVNVLGYTLGVRAAVDELRRSRGSVVLTLSSSGKFAGGAGPFYTISKHAGIGLLRHLALELGRQGVRVNGVIPGALPASDLRGPTALAQDGVGLRARHGPGRLEAVKEMTPLGVVPDEAAYTGLYLLLASKGEASVATGAVIDWDTGISAVGHGFGLAQVLREGDDLA